MEFLLYDIHNRCNMSSCLPYVAHVSGMFPHVEGHVLPVMQYIRLEPPKGESQCMLNFDSW